MKIDSSKIQAANSLSGSGHSQEVSENGLLGAFLYSLFKKKKRDDKDSQMSREDQVLAGIVTSDELLNSVAKENILKHDKNSNE